MTEFAVVLRWDGRDVDPQLLEAMNDCVHIRCPDGAWIWAEGSIGMAQADLATLPEDEPGVPVSVGGLRIVASCRLDNRDEILQTLPPEYLPRGRTDAAVILAAYQAWGESCPDRLVGDFAFAIWDAERRRLFAARDFTGARQLYIYQDGRRLFLITDRTQALQDPTLPVEVDEEQLLEFLTPTYTYWSGWDLGFFRGFKAVPAGFQLRVEGQRVSMSRFWTWRDAPPTRHSKEELLEVYAAKLGEAVRCRLRSRSSVAIELSGGLDSTAVASLAARLAGDSGPPLHTFSHVFDEVTEVDERARIRSVLDRYPQLSPHFLPADRLFGPQCLRPDWTPAGVVGPYEAWLPAVGTRTYELAVESGCRVVLTGDAGDGLNSGCDRVYFSLMRRGQWQSLLRWFGIDWKKGKTRALRRVVVHGLLPLLMPSFLFRTALLTRERLWRDPYWQLPTFITPKFAARIREIDREVRLEQVRAFPVRCSSVRSTLEILLPPMIPVTANYPVPIEIRRPYLDRRLFEMVLSMPPEMRWDPNQRGTLRAGRLHHREAMAGIMPDEVRVGNIGVEFGPAIRNSHPSDALRGWLLNDSTVHIFDRGYVIPEQFLSAIQEFEKATSREEFAYVMTFVSLEGWLRALADGGKIRRLIPPRAGAPELIYQ